MRKKKSEEAANEIPVRMVSREGLERQSVGLVYDERMLLHHCPWDPHHIESPDRLSSIWRRCSDLGLVERCVRLDSRLATEEELELYHSQSFVSKFRELGRTSEGQQFSVEEVRLSAGSLTVSTCVRGQTRPPG